MLTHMFSTILKTVKCLKVFSWGNKMLKKVLKCNIRFLKILETQKLQHRKGLKPWRFFQKFQINPKKQV